MEEKYIDKNGEPVSPIEALSKPLLRSRDNAVEHRASLGVERRWLDDEGMVDGGDDLTGDKMSLSSYVTGEASIRKLEPGRSTVIVNIVRGRGEQAIGRFSDIVLDDGSWGFKTTPVPELTDQLKMNNPVTVKGEPALDNDGNPVTLSALANNELEIANKKMKAMEKQVDDQLVECNFHGEGRKVVYDAVMAGTGVLKGPCVIKKTRKSWMQDPDAGSFVLNMVEEHRPYSKRVDYWNIYPDPYCGDDIRKCSHIWERGYVLPRELRQYMGVEGYLDDQIEKVLSEKPKRRVTAYGTRTRAMKAEDVYGEDESYETWEFNGDLSSDALEALGCDCEGMRGMLSASVLFVNDRPIKAALNMLDTGDLPYDFFVWTPVSGSVWGIGVPRILMWVQRVINAAWRAMMDNAGDSSGANVVIGDGISPIDGKWTLTGKKLWKYTGDMNDVSKAFAQFQLANNQADLQNIIDLAMKFADVETAMPMAFPAEPMGPPETLGAVELKVDASNVALRSRVKLWDDQIIVPHLRRYYHWNMQYSENDDIKGDYEVDPRGTSILLQRERASILILQLMQYRADPYFRAIIDWKKAIKQVLASQKIDILYPDDEIERIEKSMKEMEAQQSAAGDSGMEIAKLKGEFDVMKEQFRQQTKTDALAVGMEESRADREHELTLALLKREEKMMELAQKYNIALEDIRAMLSSKAMELRTQKELAGTSPQVTKPPVEPPGKAPAGKAYAL